MQKSDKLLFITSDYDGYELRYPKLLEHVNTQLDVNYWTATETKVENDALELKYKLTEEQREAVKKILPMFLRYELNVSDFWTDIYPKFFKAQECKDLAAAINMIERCVHARFYDKINKVYGLDTDEFYLSFLEDKDFKERSKWVGKLLKSKDLKQACLAFGLIEAAALFSNFALLRSFQANGYNLIPTTVKGTKSSALDERLHSLALSDSFLYYYGELGITINEDTQYLTALFEQAEIMFKNEEHIIDSIIPVTGLNKVSRQDFKDFVKRRIDEYFERLGCSKTPFGTKDSKLDAWFEIQNEAYSETDFFYGGVTKEYEVSWNAEGFGKCWN